MMNDELGCDTNRPNGKREIALKIRYCVLLVAVLASSWFVKDARAQGPGGPPPGAAAPGGPAVQAEPQESGSGAPQSLVDTIADFSFLAHFSTISRGVIDLRDLVYFALVTGFWLLANTIVLELKKAD